MQEMDTYQIEMYEDRKVIHYNGFYCQGEEMENEDGVRCTWRLDEGTWCGMGGRGSEIAFIDAIEGSKMDFIMEQFSLVQQYGGPITDEEAQEGMQWWIDNGVELPIDDVTEDTPCGMYYCYSY